MEDKHMARSGRCVQTTRERFWTCIAQPCSMFPFQSAAQTVLNEAELALCQRVYDHVISVKQIMTDAEREDLASRIIQAFQHGVKDEDALTRLLI